VSVKVTVPANLYLFGYFEVTINEDSSLDVVLKGEPGNATNVTMFGSAVAGVTDELRRQIAAACLHYLCEKMQESLKTMMSDSDGNVPDIEKFVPKGNA
jgi:hypothetical protein